jgi:hypothetical protein
VSRQYLDETVSCSLASPQGLSYHHQKGADCQIGLVDQSPSSSILFMPSWWLYEQINDGARRGCSDLARPASESGADEGEPEKGAHLCDSRACWLMVCIE